MHAPQVAGVIDVCFAFELPRMMQDEEHQSLTAYHGCKEQVHQVMNSWSLHNYNSLLVLGEQKSLYLHASKNISFALSRNHVRPNWSVWNVNWTTHSKSLLAPKPKRKAAVCIIRNLQWVVFNQSFWYSFSIPWNRPEDIILILKEATSNYLRNVVDQRWTTFLQEIIELKLQQNDQVSP